MISGLFVFIPDFLTQQLNNSTTQQLIELHFGMIKSNDKMKKDIVIQEIRDVYIAAVLEQDINKNEAWYIYFINDKNEMLESSMITSRGYLLTENGKETVSSTFRHKIGDVPPKSAVKIEMIDSQVFEIYNEYWVTFFYANRLMERKFIFGPYTIDKSFLEAVPVLENKGILVR